MQYYLFTRGDVETPSFDQACPIDTLNRLLTEIYQLSTILVMFE